MKRVRPVIASAALAAGLLSGCGGGEETFEGEARVTGYDYTEDVRVMAHEWVQYEDQSSIWSHGEIRDVDEHEEFAGCHEVSDFGFGWDDSECWTTFCSSGDNSHCEADYETLYDFESWEEVEQRNCRVEPEAHEVRAVEPRRNEDCIGDRRDGERHEVTTNYILRLVVDNPEYDAEDPGDDPRTLTDFVQFERQEWLAASRQEPVDVRIRGGEIIEATV